MNVLSLNIQGLGPKAKKQWVQELCCKNKISFLSLQETKMEEMDVNVVRSLWGNMDFEFRHSPSVGNSGGILCVWNKSFFFIKLMLLCQIILFWLREFESQQVLNF